jgi:hypothetical protein
LLAALHGFYVVKASAKAVCLTPRGAVIVVSIRFRATVTASRHAPLLDSGRYRPNIIFDFSAERAGLTTLHDFESPFSAEERKPARSTMLGVREFARLAELLQPGVTFGLFEGSHEVARGVIDEVEDRTIDLEP